MEFVIERMIEALGRTGDARILVTGDFCLDKYLFVDAARDEPSLETGKTAYQVVRRALYPGAAGTIAGNLRALGAAVSCVGIVGKDGEGFELMRCLKAIGADTQRMIATDQRCTCTYVKPMRMEDGGIAEMNRLDLRDFTTMPAEIEDRLMAAIEEALPEHDAVMICDQFVERNLSAVTDRMRDFLAGLAARNPGKVFYADSRGHIGLFRNIVVKCNASEAVRCIEPDGTMDRDDDDDVIARCGRALYARNKRPVFITMGDQGMLAQEDEMHRVPPFSVEGPVDICGAGDAASSGIVLGLVLGMSVPEAALLGNAVASITIQQIGVTGTASVQQVAELLASIRQPRPQGDG